MGRFENTASLFFFISHLGALAGETFFSETSFPKIFLRVSFERDTSVFFFVAEAAVVSLSHSPDDPILKLSFFNACVVSRDWHHSKFEKTGCEITYWDFGEERDEHMRACDPSCDF